MVTYAKISPVKHGEPQRYSWECRRARRASLCWSSCIADRQTEEMDRQTEIQPQLPMAYVYILQVLKEVWQVRLGECLQMCQCLLECGENRQRRQKQTVRQILR